jgi:hypothetical protein
VQRGVEQAKGERVVVLESLVAEHEGFLPDIKVPLFYVSLQTHDNNFTPFLRRFVTRNKNALQWKSVFCFGGYLKRSRALEAQAFAALRVSEAKHARVQT